jgi:hypothetical protein
MTEYTVFEFYSDTNLSNAFEELQLMSPDFLEKSGTQIHLGWADFLDSEDEYLAIVAQNGGHRGG